MELTTTELHVAPSPHLSKIGQSTQRMMMDVLIALAPVTAMALFVFQWYAVKQLAVCLISCLAAEALFTKMRRQPLHLKDFSAVVTGVILALSLPGTAPWFVGFIASFVAMGIGKIIFGGIGMNLFNPAMVGRAFVMIAFASMMGASGYEDAGSYVDVITQATPLTAFKQSGIGSPLSSLFLGITNGSLGETSALACLLGGIYLCLRRTALLGNPRWGAGCGRDCWRHQRSCRQRGCMDNDSPPVGRSASFRSLFHCYGSGIEPPDA